MTKRSLRGFFGMILLGSATAQVCLNGLSCQQCPACVNTTECAADPVILPPKSDFWPPEDILQRPYGPGPVEPANLPAELEWLQTTVLNVLPDTTKQSETDYALTDTEEFLVKMSLVDWQAARAAGMYSCEEMATALTKRAMYMQEIQKMNSFMYWGSFDWVTVVLDQAKALDATAAVQGVDAIAPLYCYPVPLKGTMATKDFPSSSGFAALHDKFALEDADLVKLVRDANGVLFGKTNVPEFAHSWGTGNYANGLAFNPWGHDVMPGGSSGGSGAAVASYTAALAITEDTEGSTNTPAVRNHLFGYDPPKFHYPNSGNPSLAYRNDQLGLNARSIDDIIAFDMAVLGTATAHAAAKSYVDSLDNSDIKLGCSLVYYAYDDVTDAIRSKYEEAEQTLKGAGFSFAENCQETNPMDEVPDPEGSTGPYAVWFEELSNFISVTLGLPNLNPWEVLLNGFYDFGTTLSANWMYDYSQESGCNLISGNNEDARAQFLGPIPAARSDVYNQYFDTEGVDLLMGPGQLCDRVLLSEDLGANGGCDGGRFPSGCMWNCHTQGVLGSRDKTFTKAKFVVPIGLTEVGQPLSIHFMSRAGPRDAEVPASEWVFDEEGPKTWNLEELYMVKRISDALAEDGLSRAEAPLNEISGLTGLFEPTCSSESLSCAECPGCVGFAVCADESIALPPKSDFWPPQELLKRPFGPGPVSEGDLAAELEWFQSTVLDMYPSMTEQGETDFALTTKEETLIKMGLSEWQEVRAQGKYSCEEMATAVTKRAAYLQEFQKMNNFMYWDSFDWVQVVIAQAKSLDGIAAVQGTEAIAPLFCYPVPLKGTMATVDFPSSSGFAALHDYFAVEDADLVKLISEANGVLFGKTNVPEFAHSWGTGNYANGISFNPWGHDVMTGGSSGGSGAAVASYTAAIAITEDTSGSTNTPAVRNHLFGYDPPKFHYPNGGNPSLTYRNDQLGTNARSIDDIISFDVAVLGTNDAHQTAKSFVDSLSNEDITIGCSLVYYAYNDMSDAIKAKYEEAEAILKAAGFKFIEDCQETNPMEEVPDPEGLSASAVWYEELSSFISDTLGLSTLTAWDVLLNGYYDFGTTLSAGWMYGSQKGGGCDLINKHSEEARDLYLGPIPAGRSVVYNEYFDANSVDLLMGPGQLCDRVLWSEDMGANGGCDGGRFGSNCMFNCHTVGVLGTRDKSFTKAKFVVPIGLTTEGEPLSIQFMSRAGPRNPTVPPSEWVYDEEGPKTWNLEELYMVKRIADVLEAEGLSRAEAPLNKISGLTGLFEPTCSNESLSCSECPGCEGFAVCAVEPVELPPKSDFWPPQELLKRPFGPGPVSEGDLAAELEWFESTVLDMYPSTTKQAETEFALTVREEEMLYMGLSEWQKARADGMYTCEEMAVAVTKRASYLQEVQKMNNFMYWGTFDWIQVVLDQATALDDIAGAQGVGAIAPLYCYPIPLKGTMATVAFPSSSGFAALHDKLAVKDADLVTLISEANGVLFGKTNVPEFAHSWGTGNYANGLCFNPWGHDVMTGGSSGGSGAAVASYTATIAITEDTSGSTNTPAVRNHLFGYDPPKFHYPNGGNPSLSYRNDQLGTNARSIDDIISFDMAVLGTEDAHAAAKAFVDGLPNKDIVIGCSSVYYAYQDMSDAIRVKYDEAQLVLSEAGFTFVDDCQETNPMEEVPAPEGTYRNAVWYEELATFIGETLALPNLSPWDVLLNGYYDFGTTLSQGWMYGSKKGSGCDVINKHSEEAREMYLGPIPAARSDVYNEYFDKYSVDVLMGPGQICDKVLWSEDMGANGGCDGGRFPSNCMWNCHTYGVLGSRDKSFTKAKFVVPIGLTDVDEPLSIQFMSRAGPRNPTIPASEWVYDEEGPKTWNLEELYMVKRISDTLSEAGLARADAPLNEISGLKVPKVTPPLVVDDDDDDDDTKTGGISNGGLAGIILGFFVVIASIICATIKYSKKPELVQKKTFETEADGVEEALH